MNRDRFAPRSASSDSTYAVAVFLFFLGGIALQLILPPICGIDCDLRIKLLCSGFITTAAFLTASSYYGNVLIPLMCCIQGIIVGSTANTIALSFLASDPEWKIIILLLLQVPIFFVFAREGMKNSAVLHRLHGDSGLICSEELFVMVALLLGNAVSTYWFAYNKF